jgi:hypothetical protein
VDALDSQRLTDDLISILSGEVTEIPRYSFKDNNPLPRQAVALLTAHPFFSPTRSAAQRCACALSRQQPLCAALVSGTSEAVLWVSYAGGKAS